MLPSADISAAKYEDFYDIRSELLLLHVLLLMLVNYFNELSTKCQTHSSLLKKYIITLFKFKLLN